MHLPIVPLIVAASFTPTISSLSSEPVVIAHGTGTCARAVHHRSSAGAANSLSDTTATKAALMQADRALGDAVALRGQAAVAALLDSEAAVLIPGQPILHGPGESAPALHSRYDAPAVYRWTPTHAVASADGKFGCTVGVSTFVDAADTSHTEYAGRYITCWSRGSDDSWRIVAQQRADRQAPLGNHPLDSTLAGAPHSATVASNIGASALRSKIQDNEAAYGVMGRSGATGPGPAFVAHAAEDAVLMPGFELARGKKGIEDAFKDWPSNAVLEWGPDKRFGGGSGGLAYSTGNSLTHDSADPAKVLRRGHFLTVWREEPDGRWLYIFDLGSPRPPLADGR